MGPRASLVVLDMRKKVSITQEVEPWIIQPRAILYTTSAFQASKM